jgi:deoxyribonuclease IV
MLIGAHVSAAGGLAMTITRGVERGCRAIQIFSQSPRMWRATAYREQDVEDFRRAMAESPVDAVLIHTVYLLNCASEDAGIRAKTLASLVQALRAGASLGASGVVLHAGSAKRGEVRAAIGRAGATIRRALADSEGCELHLENTAGAGGTLGRSLAELGELIAAAGGDERLKVCLDSCHLLASGYDVRTPRAMDAVIGGVAAELGLERLGSLHLNDSQAPLGSGRDRHANVGDGEIGERGCAAFLGTPALQGLPCVLETPGEKHGGAKREEVELAMRLHARGVAARRRAAGRATRPLGASARGGGGKRR